MYKRDCSLGMRPAFILVPALFVLTSNGVQAATFTATSQAVGCEDGSSSSTGADASCTGSLLDFSTGATAKSQPGILSVTAESVSTRSDTGVGTFSGRALATAFFSDVIFFGIDSGSFLIPLDFDGTLTTRIDQSTASADGAIATISGGFNSTTIFSATDDSGSTSGIEYAMLSFTEGLLRITGGLRAEAIACSIIDPGNTCLATADYGSSLRLLGGTVFDEFGNEVMNASVWSESGFDYLAGAEPHNRVTPVPLPASMLLLLSGLLGMLGIGRMKRNPLAS